MSYRKKIEYGNIAKQSFKIYYRCAKCRCKKKFINTGKFRVNANGHKLDVWLIYQCEKCKHTYNLSIYERISPFKVPEEEYKKFMENDEELALLYGRNKELFMKNKAEIVK